MRMENTNLMDLLKNEAQNLVGHLLNIGRLSHSH